MFLSQGRVIINQIAYVPNCIYDNNILAITMDLFIWQGYNNQMITGVRTYSSKSI